MTSAAGNRQHGLWLPLVFVVPGVIALLVGVVTLQPFLIVWGLGFGGGGAVFLVAGLRSHKQAVPSEVTAAALASAGWQDATPAVRDDPVRLLPDPVRDHLRLGDPGDTAVARLAGIHAHQPQAAAIHRGLWHDPVMVAESWIVTATHSTNDRVTGGNIEPRVVAWTYLPAAVGNVTIRPDNARMKLADLTGVAADHTVDWDAVDTTWHLHGDDEALLRAVVDIGLMGRLADLPGRWIVRFGGQVLMVVPTAPRNRLTARPPTLADVADEIGAVVAAVRSILPQMLWSDLDGMLAGYRH